MKRDSKSPKVIIRDNYLDALKGLTIYLVVLGHAIQTHQAAFDNNPLFRLIYSFHMPLFMFISGAVASYSKKPMDFKFMKNKFMTLVVPFTAWAIIGYFLPSRRHETFFVYAKTIAKSPDAGLWFLWVLFLIFSTIAAAVWLRKRIGRISYVAVPLIVYTIPASKLGLGLLRWHLPFFLAGMLIFRYQKELMKYKQVVLYGCLFIFPILVFKWHRAAEPFFGEHLRASLAARGLLYIPVGDVLTLDSYGIVRMMYYYLVAFSGIGAVYYLFNTTIAKLMHPLFNKLGFYTLDIYAMSNYFLFTGIGFGFFWLEVFTASIFAVIIPLIISILLIRRVNILNKILLGGRTVTKT